MSPVCPTGSELSAGPNFGEAANGCKQRKMKPWLQWLQVSRWLRGVLKLIFFHISLASNEQFALFAPILL